MKIKIKIIIIKSSANIFPLISDVLLFPVAHFVTFPLISDALLFLDTPIVDAFFLPLILYCFKTPLSACFSDTPISDAVITVPSYFTQSERRAVKEAAELVGINVLQLISDNVAGNRNNVKFTQKSLVSTVYLFIYTHIHMHYVKNVH